MAHSTAEPSRLEGYEAQARRAHEAAIAELRDQSQGPMNGPTYALRYTDLFRAYFDNPPDRRV